MRRLPARRADRLGLLLILLGLAACGDITSFSLTISTWGGGHIGLVITATGGTVEYDCAMGRIDQPIVVREGRFDVTGVHWPGQGGPIGVDTTRTPRPARYQGTVKGDWMTLRVTLTDTGEPLGPFLLQRGGNPQVVKCL
jgi:hypothetical protein